MGGRTVIRTGKICFVVFFGCVCQLNFVYESITKSGCLCQLYETTKYDFAWIIHQ